MKHLLRLGGAALMIVLISFGGGGLVVALDHPATGAARPELTSRGDAAFRRAVTPLAASLDGLAARTDALAAAGREASFALRTLDPDTVRAHLADGEAELVGAVFAVEEVRSNTDRLLAEVSGLRLSVRATSALAAVDEASGVVATLSDDQARIASAAGMAAEVIEAFQTHDEVVFRATEAARDERYTAALSTLAEATGLLAPILADRQDDGARQAPTLDGWLLRANDYDAALRRLYDILEASGGQPTAASRAAAGDVDRAQAALSADASALAVIASEMAEPELTGALVGIEAVRGSVAEAVRALD